MNDHPSIAVVGMAGRFPGADSVAELWRLIEEGQEAVRTYSDAELLRAGADPDAIRGPNWVKRGSHLRDVEYFDAAFFGYTGREAELMDPQQRIFLEVCHEALEDAGHGPGTFDGAVGVYAGTRRSGYQDLLDRPEYDNVTDSFVKQGNEPDALVTKVAYKLDCTGPAFTVQTFCSTSLVAVHLACQQLLDGECDLALAGGVALRLPQHVGYRYQEGGTLSPEGRCRPFDADGNGLIFGDGAAVVVLRRLEDALEDGDNVLAVIRGSVINNDGARRAGYTAPGVSGQARAVREAILAAAVDASMIGYVETHGAGTPLGDSVELAALTAAFDTDLRGVCAIGSVKSNVGHLDSASGVTALIKTVQALRHRTIPASLHFDVPNPELDFLNSPFHVSTESSEWHPIDGRRIAGVNSLGIGGTNAHVIVEEAPAAASAPTGAGEHLFVLSAKTPEALDLAAGALRRFLEDHPEVPTADIAFTLQRGRQAYRHRRWWIASHNEDAALALAEGRYHGSDSVRAGAEPPAVPPTGTDPLSRLGAAWLAGDRIDWTTLYRGERRRRVSLPTHPMLRKRHWPETEPAQPPTPTAPAPVSAVAPAEHTDTEDAAVAVQNEDVSMNSLLLDELRTLVAARFKIHPDELDDSVPFLEMGADSLLLLSILQPLEERYGCKLSMRQFFREFQTLAELAVYLEKTADADRLPTAAAAPAPAAAPVAEPVAQAPVAPAPAVTESTAPAPAAPRQIAAPAVENALPAVPASVSPASPAPQQVGPVAAVPMSAIERIAAEQLKVMGRQLDLMGGAAAVVPAIETAVPAPAVLPAVSSEPVAALEAAARVEPAVPSAAARTAAAAQTVAGAQTAAPIVPLAPRMRSQAQIADTAARTRYLESFTDRFSAKMARSKEFAQRFRPVIADSRSTIGFRMSTKELLFPIVAERGRGARLWDVDGNEYVDLTMGFGVHYFGHQHAPIVDSLRERMDTGFGLGPRTELVEDVAASILKLTGMERVAFVNTGSEAVMTAVRLARAATRRDRIVIFSNGYHGHADPVLAAPTWVDGELRTKPIATGVTRRSVEDVVVLEFGTEAALEYIEQHGPELAAVMVEPVTTRHPGDQRPDFLRKLRELTHRHGAKLIFDEMVTGFRAHPGGIQGLYGIEADLTTYGKIIGGGLPLGVVAGRGGVMDSIDGGVWNYGDDSFPTVESTFFGGTFCQHPLSMVAAKTVLDELIASGPALQEALGRRTALFTEALNADFRALDVPITVDRFASLFRFEHEANMDLFFYNLLEKGVYIWEWRCCFLSTSHTDEDLAFVRKAIRESIGELREAGLLAPLSASAPALAPLYGPDGAALPLSDPQAAGALTAPAPATPRAAAPAPAVVEDKALTLPVGRAQKQLWALANLSEDGSLAYDLHVDFWLDGPLDRAALRVAVRGLLARHQSLRLTMAPDGESALVRPVAEISLDDVLTFERASGPAELDRLLDPAGRSPFDLVRGPLVHVLVVESAPERHLLHLRVHHLIADGWSTVPLIGDLTELYSAACRGTEAKLDPAPQPGDFRAWQDELAAAPEAAAHRDHWATVLKGAAESALPGSDQGQLPTFRSERRTLTLDSDFFARLRREAGAQGVTPFAYLVSAWGMLLRRITGQDDLIMLAPSAGRPPHLEQMVGYCTNLMPLRFRVAGDAQVGPCVEDMQDQLLDAMEHDTHPFADTVAAVDAQAPGLSRRLFTNVIVFDREVPLPAVQGLTVSEAAVAPRRHSPYPLMVTITDTGSGLRCDFDVQRDVLPAGMGQQIPGMFRNLLTEMVADSGRSMAAIDILDEDERALILGWGRGPEIELGDLTVCELFERQAAETPDRTAVVCEDRVLTYAELDDRANRLAEVLRDRLPVGPETIVGIRLPRSERFLVTILALWKCGAAYVPLEPKHPIRRHLTVLELCQAVGVVSEADHEPEGDTTLPWLRYGELVAEGARLESAAPVADRPMNAPAYVMFSSGSTGEPKGIVIEQRAMLNHVLAKIEDYDVDGDSVLAQNAPSSFDISVWQFVAPLLNGGSVRVYPDSVVEDPAVLIRQVDEHRVSTLELVPSYLAMMLDEPALTGGQVLFPALRHVVLQAEPLKPSLVERWYRSFPDIAMSNAYGATETADDVLHPRTRVPDSDLTPTGKPIRNASIYIVDEEFRLVPPGVRGELLVAGVPVGRGYLERTPANAAAFLPYNPVEPERSGPVYRTGDMARWREDGDIEILGRDDHQVKVRGQRVELGEIERVLHGLDGVADAVVKDFPAPESAGARLVAYLVEAAGRTLDTQVLKAELGERLPDYMVPAQFVVLDALPLNTSGKVDRKALAEPAAPTGKAAPVSPRHYLDDLVLRCARAVIGHGQIGLGDDFFQLGGNSISAVRLVQMIREEAQIELPVVTVFDRPTLRELSDAVLGASFDAYAPIPRAEAKPAYRTSASEERMYFLSMLDPSSRLYNIPMAYVVDGTVELDRLRHAVDAVAVKHDILRTTFDMEDGRLVQRVLDTVRVPVSDLGVTDESLEDLVQGWVTPHDLRTGPPLRMAVARRSQGEEHVLLLDMPHIVFDEGSVGALFRDLSAAYRGEQLEPAALTYKDFAEWEHVYRTSEGFRKDRSYWLDRFQNPPATGDFPQRPRPAVLDMVGQRHSFSLDAELTAGLRAYCRKHRVTPYMVLLAVFNTLLSKYTGQQELVVGTPVDGRYHPACADIIGMFGNSLPLRTAPADGKSFEAYTNEVRGAVLEGLQHQAYPFEELVRELDLPRDPSRNPLFDLMFVFTDLSHASFDMDGAVGTPAPVSIGVARMDMTFSAYERPDTIEVIQEYATDVFDLDTVEQMAHHFTHLVRQALAAPQRPLAELSLVTEDERVRLTSGQGTFESVPDNDLTLHELFERAVDAEPTRTAVVSGTVRLGYAELDERANRLARVLREDLGVEREHPVGLLLDEPHDIVTAMLGVLKAGGAYVPFDRSTPPARVRDLLAHSGAGVLISDLLTQDDVPEGVRLLRPDAPEIAAASGDRLPNVNGPADLVYIMFTSGSTGRPKGVLVEHTGVRRVSHKAEYIPSLDGERVLQATSWGFDVSAVSMYGALLNGGTLVCPSRGELLDPTLLRELVTREDVGLAFFSTAFFHMLADVATDSLEPIRTLVVAGERMSAEHARRTLARLGAGRLINAYGPTEGTVFATAFRIEELDEDTVSVPIGAAVDETRVYILMPHGEPAPEGIAGELCIAGPGVARGYLGAEDDTDGPFQPDPFVPGDRMYRTGDVARLLPGGLVDFMGRRDDQLKIRGFRVEPAEIEAALRTCAGIKDARVVARVAEHDGELELNAYLVGDEGLRIPAVREELRSLVPHYMLPGHYVAMDRLPLNSSGKVDRNALPQAERHSEPRPAEGDGARTATEERLLRVWVDVLDLSSASPSDNFFMVGGHSLKAVALIAEVREIFDVEVRLIDFLAAPTVHNLAEQIDNLLWAAGGAQDAAPTDTHEEIVF
ncbi:amino acid adenylation domain-containing protein [Streptomyces sp. NBC_01618]|uniref:amino acid adenylation domain-containing protein n=1 Tax=Streptomyces sp. NBC_01618 TaxID=2975900 RepID=UPI003863DF10|nr:amino acid adenylation domain-containing protein [Streptomyces sp. NBC_01618]